MGAGLAQQIGDFAPLVPLQDLAILPETVIFDVKTGVVDAPMTAAECQQALGIGLVRGRLVKR